MDGDAVAVGDDDLLNVVQRVDHAFGSDVVSAVDLLDVAATGVLVVAGQGLEHLADGDVERIEGIGVHGHLILLQIAAKAVNLYDAGNAGELALHYPVLDGAQLHGVVTLLVAGGYVEGVLVDFAQTGGYGHHLGGAQLSGYLACHGLNLFADELSGLQGGYALLEDHGDQRETEAAHRANLFDIHDVAHGNLDGEGDELLHLLRGQGRGDGDYLHLVVGDVGHGIDWQCHHGIQSS